MIPASFVYDDIIKALARYIYSTKSIDIPIYEKEWAQPGFEPGTSRTLSENHTPRPTSLSYQWYYIISPITIHLKTITSFLVRKQAKSRPFSLYNHIKQLDNEISLFVLAIRTFVSYYFESYAGGRILLNHPIKFNQKLGR